MGPYDRGHGDDVGKLTDEERARAAQAKGGAGRDDPRVRKAARELVAFPNAYPGREYVVRIECPEFTAVCPMTDQPDFGRIDIEYVPQDKLVELKSLKLYLQAYRDVGIFHETVTNAILDDLVSLLEPQKITVSGDYNLRGGIRTVVRAEWANPGPGRKARRD
jgi:7-cyano-7-deazaguanine reductase